MKMKLAAVVAACAAVGLYLNLGCDWSSQGTSLNTSQGAGVNINFSGVYEGAIDGKAVAKTSKGTISRLVIQQTGNRLEVTDSQGSRYEGSVGSPGLVADPRTDGTYPPGAELVQSQISFSGRDGVAQRDIEFVGIIHAVAVKDVRGTTTTETTGGGTTNASSSTSSDVQEGKITTVVNNGETTTTIEELTVGVPGVPGFYQKTTTTITTDNKTGQEISRTVKTENIEVESDSATTGSSTTTTTTYEITEANSQYRLEGTWIEKDSPIVSRVDALSRGTFGIITIVSGGGGQEGGSSGGGGTDTGTTTTE